MNKIMKITLLALLLFLTLPTKQFAQTPYRQYADDGILMNFHEIDNVDFRVFLLYNLSQGNLFDLIAEDEPGLFIINSNGDRNSTGFFEDFESFYQNTYSDFSMLSKMDIYDLAPIWKSSVMPSYFASIMMDVALRRTRVGNDHCALSNPFCTSNEIQFLAATTSQTADQLEGGTFDVGCIGSSYNPSWYHMRINNPGQFIIHIEGVDPNNSSTSRDIDFCMWGPFTDPTTPCVSQLTTNKIIDCSISPYHDEDVYLGYQESLHSHHTYSHGTVNYHLPASGEYYILMIINFSQQPCVITFTKTPGSGPGTTDCGILPVASNDGPYCVGETIHLSANAQDGASYSWTGPNGYISNQQNPVRPNCTLNMAGTYTCVATMGGESSTVSTEVVIFAMPTADFEATTVCEGQATQFNSTSTTNPPGQEIVTYVWSFGDGQSGTGQNTSHIYAQPGNYLATLTVQTSSVCSDQITKLVTVNPIPSYTISVSATPINGGEPYVGDTPGTTNGTYTDQQSCTIHANPNSGYSFTNWTENGQVVTDAQADYTFPVTGNRILVAHFNENNPEYTITVIADPTNGGTVSGSGTYAQGSTVTLHAFPNSDYSFVNWTKNGTAVSSNADLLITVSENATYVAHFNEIIPEYTITVNADPANGGEVSGGGTYQLGATCVLRAYPNAGFVFENWTHNGIEVSTNPTYDFEVTRDATYVAHFMQDANHFSITAMAEPVEGGAVLGSGTYELGGQCTLSAIPAVGFEFVNWTTQEGTQVSIENPFRFLVTSNTVYVAHFERIVNHYTVTANVEPIGAGSVVGAGTFDEGNNCTLIAIPNSMYSFVSWTENGIVVDINDHYTFSVDRDRNLVAVFSQDLFFTITASAGANGNISPEGEVMVTPGEDKTFSMIPNSACQVSKVLVDGVDRGPIPSYTFRNVNENHTIHVEFSGLGMDDNVGFDLKVYPNPANDKINIESPKMKKIAVFDMLGVQIESMEVHDEQTTISLKGYSPGTYILKVECLDESIGYSRFVVIE